VGKLDGSTVFVGKPDGRNDDEGSSEGDWDGAAVGEGVRYVESEIKKVLRRSQSVLVIVRFKNLVQFTKPISSSFRSGAPRSRKVKRCNDSISALGMTPLNLLFARFRVFSFCNDPISLGIVPVNLLPSVVSKYHAPGSVRNTAHFCPWDEVIATAPVLTQVQKEKRRNPSNFVWETTFQFVPS